METIVRKPRDFDAELKAPGDKTRDLKSRKVQRLGRWIQKELDAEEKKEG